MGQAREGRVTAGGPAFKLDKNRWLVFLEDFIAPL